ncbi:phage major capsid protein [Bacillus sp. FSL R12-0069]|uniref:phage major capsid protein n=1 Tax=Bacillus sp. FSL R12-0069 TaxID=2975342 RepID=UPI0030FB7CFC
MLSRTYISRSLFNVLDLLKDKNGRYLLQDDITVASGKRVKGKEVVVLDDDIIGTKAGDLVGFVGDAKEFCTLFNRKQASVKWIDNDIYGQLLAGFVRFDVKKVDSQAGYYITYTAAPAGA